MRLLLLVLALSACAARTDQKPAPAADPAAKDAATPPPESTPTGGSPCTADAQCPGRPSVHCSGEGGGRCVATDGVGCGFIPEGGELQARCCDGTAGCNPDTLTAPPAP